MVRHKIKKAVAIAMSAVIALTAVPNLPLQYEKKQKLPRRKYLLLM